MIDFWLLPISANFAILLILNLFFTPPAAELFAWNLKNVSKLLFAFQSIAKTTVDRNKIK